MFAMALND